MTTADELELLDQRMALVADGDRSAVGPLFRALWPAIHAYCERALGAGADADDAARQAMEKVFQEASRYDRARRAMPWALAIALWECRTVRRRRQRSRAVGLEDLSELPAPAMTPEDAAIQAQLVAVARELFATLSPTDRGTDVALESADVVLMRSDPHDVLVAIELSHATLRKMHQNLIWAVAQNAIAFPAAAGVFYPFIIRPEIAALAMSGSTALVAANALLLKRWNPRGEASSSGAARVVRGAPSRPSRGLA